ncbi:MFS transporter [Dyella tabacisoli]|uniref:MFS transporter n=1 Tax=Dyella tabacisoli TaxID=2282381 RepID=A0A369URD6_9GAMM|nr:MFS transporter [Dyella tabacisoli]RDD83081.1 MFS transporter [Dyella tabacisoli]
MTTRNRGIDPADDRSTVRAAAAAPARLPMAALLALAASIFITILTETLPAALLPQMSASLRVSEPLVGQLVSIYAIGSIVAAIPLTIATQGWGRKLLLLIAVGGFAVVNTVTAISTSYELTLVARFFAGVFAGLLWALVAGYAARMVPEHQQGRAIAIAMVGTPLALTIGIPAGTFLGTAIGWQYTFGTMSLLTLLLVAWMVIKLPNFAGQPAGKRLPISSVFSLPGVKPVLFVTLTYILAHNILYTYIVPFLVPAGMADRIDVVLLVFGLAALLGIWIVGVLIDRWMRELVIASTALFTVAALVLGLWGKNPMIVYACIAAWGLAYGGTATLFQTASAKAAGSAADVAQSIIVTVWNVAIAGGGLIGGILLNSSSVTYFPWTLLTLLVLALLVAFNARSAGFPSAKAA